VENSTFPTTFESPPFEEPQQVKMPFTPKTRRHANTRTERRKREEKKKFESVRL
jgi:hypothetical protein